MHPPQPLPDLGESAENSRCFWSRGAVVHPAALQFPGSRAPGFPGFAALRLPGAGARSPPGAGELGPPRLRTVMPGLGAGAPPSSPAHSLAPALFPAPSPLLPQLCRLRTADACRPPRARRLQRYPAGPFDPRAPVVLPLLPRAPRLNRLAKFGARSRYAGGVAGTQGGRWPQRSPGRSRMRQDKLTGSLRRGGRCLKRQGGGGGGGGVGTILSNVLKKRSCISRTAPRLLCTLEPGEDPGLQIGHWKVAWRPGAGASASVGLRLGRGALAGRLVRGSAAPRRRGWVDLGGKTADEGLGAGSGLPRLGGPAAAGSCRRVPTPRPVRGLALFVPGAASERCARPCACDRAVPAATQGTRGRATNCAPGLQEARS